MQLLRALSCRQVDIGRNSCRDPDRTCERQPMVARGRSYSPSPAPLCCLITRSPLNSRNHYHSRVESVGIRKIGIPFFRLSVSVVPFFRHSLRQHMLRHAGKKYKCGLPGCPTVLRTASELRSHVSLVHDATPSTRRYKCSDCSYAAKTRTQLRR